MLTWWTCCYHCTNTVQDKALIPKDILPSHWYDQNQGLDSIHYPQKGKPQKNQKSLLQFSRELLHSLIFASKVNPSSSRGRPPKWRSMEAPTTGKKLTQAMPVTDACFDQTVQALIPTKIDADYAVFQVLDLSLFTGWSQLFPCKTIDKYIHVFTFFQI